MEEEQLFSSNNRQTLEPVVGLPCIFCGTDKSNEFSLGKIIHQEGFTVHYYCMLFSCGLAQQDDMDDGILGFCYSDLRKEYLRGRRLSCFYCKKRGATVGCCYKKCRRGFHLSCGQSNGTLHQFFGMFLSFCDKHRPMQNITVEQSRKECVCPICFESVESKASRNTLWASCCNVSWFHRDCIQMQALSAGYFFKCPLCNNCEDFKREMEIYGIYIPEKDAAWEMVDNAYEDLLFRYSHCDAPCCLCPKGRKFSNNSQWDIVLCDTCGSAGCHRDCGMLTQYTTVWKCNDCQLISQKFEAKAAILKPTKQNRSRRILSSQKVEKTLKNELTLVSGCNSAVDGQPSNDKEMLTKYDVTASSCKENNDGINMQNKIGRPRIRPQKPENADGANNQPLPSDEPPKLEMCVPNSETQNTSTETISCESHSQTKDSDPDSTVCSVPANSDVVVKHKRQYESTDESTSLPTKKHCDCGNSACTTFLMNYFRPLRDDIKCTTAGH